MLSAIFKLILAVIVFQILGAVVRAFRRPSRKSFSPEKDEDRVKKPDYNDLTPYEIEDAEFEELPDDKA